MPIKRCVTEGGKLGWKWGNKGKCYTSKARAERQMRAIQANKYKRRNKK